MKNKFFLLILVIIIAGVLFFIANKGGENESDYTYVYDGDTEIVENLVILENESMLIKNNAWIKVLGDTEIKGKVACTGGAINMEFLGNLKVEGTLKCERDQDLDDNDLGLGINLVAAKDIEFSNDAVVVSNGHVQLVDDKSKLVETEEEINDLYDDAASDTGDGLRVGPMVPIEFEETETSFNKCNNWFYKFTNKFVKSAHAQEPARDIYDLPVENTVRIRGTWIVGGWPVGPPPPNLNIPTPPKKIKRIILNFNFGPGRNVNLQDWELSGPDGRYGEDDLRNSCDAKGKKGENAFRFRVLAHNLNINNFKLNLGSGGDGGSAETKKDCDPGIARGGDAGEPGNFKMISSGNFNISGEFRVRPGQGGSGGDATAYGKDGKDGCPGEDGKDALAYGGKGGDNKKGLKISGTVNGIANIVIEDIVAGRGGDAWAIAGWGGIGDGADCDGGNGGKATAEAGKGGDAASRTVASHGGDGGDAEAMGGDGGFGGKGDAKTPGGDGGRGGDAVANPGKGGTGLTLFGAQGNYKEEGGDGGNGGDGCPEGKGGEGGKGEAPGKKGEDGKNICPVAPKAGGGVKAGDDVKPEPKKDGGDAKAGGDVIGLNLNPAGFTFEHIIGTTECPTPIGTSQVTGTPGNTWRLSGSAPSWLTVSDSGTLPGSMSLEFSCILNDYVTQELNTTLPVQQFDSSGNPVGDPVNVDVLGYIEG